MEKLFDWIINHDEISVLCCPNFNLVRTIKKLGIYVDNINFDINYKDMPNVICSDFVFAVENIFCVFGDRVRLEVPATFVSPTELQCGTPFLPGGSSYAVRVKQYSAMDHSASISRSLAFFYVYHDLEVSSLEPKNGPLQDP